ncbi:serine threonine-protein phosphatase 6 regulatory subunit [Musa troglodytarum]|uniref:Serine threonine-protein phosphatase 6 regulatory subunit n=1 Tax=Musa troglodytarum TaxID=320322 RepID=A0A9E7FW25_9LILI|nr:serine threonine-protein phosphatase 6 regulatory subunit [Musa troglodytarum]
MPLPFVDGEEDVDHTRLGVASAQWSSVTRLSGLALPGHLDDLLKVLNVSSDVTTLPTTYGELHPPLGRHRLKVTVPAPGRQPVRPGNIGHITRICNKLVQLGSNNDHIRSYLQAKD